MKREAPEYMEQSSRPLDLVVRGDIVLPGRLLRDGAVGIVDGRIVGVFEHGFTLPRRTVVDARGQYVLPGVIDAHVHCFSAPKEGFTHATRAAAAGGVTTIIDMPYDMGNPVVSRDRFLEKRIRLERESVVDVALLATIKKTGGLDQIPLLAKEGACGFKMSLYETDPTRFPRIPDPELLEAFSLIQETGLPVGLHAENDELVRWGFERYRSDGNDPQAHGRSRPRVAESSAVLKALEFAFWTGVHLHIYHASFPRVFELVDWFRRQGTRVSAETCIHYLTLTEDDMERLGARAKINPPLRSVAERAMLWELCRTGSVDIVTSDHAPWTLDRKSHSNIFDNASGAPGVEVLVSMIYSEGVAKGRLTIHDLARLLSQKPTEIFGLSPRKGQIRVGGDADLTIIDPTVEWTLDEERLLSTAGWSPYHGWPVQGRVTKTILRGQVVFDGDQVVGEPGMGQFVPGQHRR
jgi:allantoinase